MSPNYIPRPFPTLDAGLSLAPRCPLKPQGDSPAHASTPGARPEPRDTFFPEHCPHPPPSLERNSKSNPSPPPSAYAEVRTPQPFSPATFAVPNLPPHRGPQPPTAPRREGQQEPRLSAARPTRAHTAPRGRLQPHRTQDPGHFVLLASTSRSRCSGPYGTGRSIKRGLAS